MLTVGLLTMASTAAQGPVEVANTSSHGSIATRNNGPAAAITIKSADGEVTVVLTELERPGKLHQLWRDTHNARVLHRVDAHRLLLQRGGKDGPLAPATVNLLDTDTGKTRKLAECWWPDPIEVHDGRVLLLTSGRQSRRRLFSLSLETGATPQQIGDVKFSRMTAVSGNQVTAIEAENRGVWNIDLRRNTCKRLIELAPLTADVNIETSPNGQRIALGITRFNIGEIVVLDAGSGNVVRRWSDLPVRSDLFVPELPIAFVDDDVLASIETGQRRNTSVDHWRVTRSLTSGKELGRKRAKWSIMPGLGAERTHREELLDKPSAWPPTKGSVLSQLHSPPSWFTLSPDGKHAVVQLEDNGQAQLIGAGAPIELGAGTILDCRWLPAVGSCVTDHSSGQQRARYSAPPIKKPPIKQPAIRK